MNESAPPPPVPASLPPVSADAVFAALGEPIRRKIFMKLFDGQPHLLRDFGGTYRHQIDNLRKHLAILVKSGLVLTEPDPQDPRRNHYRFAPFIRTETTPQGRTIDFGHGTMRF